MKVRYHWQNEWHYVDLYEDNTAIKFKEFENRAKTSRFMRCVGLKDLNGDLIFEGQSCKNSVGEHGLIMYNDGVFFIAYYEEPAKEYLHQLVVKDKDYCSTGVCNLEITDNSPPR